MNYFDLISQDLNRLILLSLSFEDIHPLYQGFCSWPISLSDDLSKKSEGICIRSGDLIWTQLYKRDIESGSSIFARFLAFAACSCTGTSFFTGGPNNFKAFSNF